MSKSTWTCIALAPVYVHIKPRILVPVHTGLSYAASKIASYFYAMLVLKICYYSFFAPFFSFSFFLALFHVRRRRPLSSLSKQDTSPSSSFPHLFGQARQHSLRILHSRIEQPAAVSAHVRRRRGREEEAAYPKEKISKGKDTDMGNKEGGRKLY